MIDHIANRDRILRTLREELVGPSPHGSPIDCSIPVVFATRDESYGPWRQQANNEEILQRDPPFQRYGVGVLSPLPLESPQTQTTSDDEVGQIDGDIRDLDVIPGTVTDDEEAETSRPDIVSDAVADRLNRVANRVHGTGAGEDTDDIILATANARKPSSMAVSFFADLPDDAVLEIEAFGGRYREVSARVGDAQRPWWLRSQVAVTNRYASQSVRSSNRAQIEPGDSQAVNTEGLDIRIEVFARNITSHPTERLITVCLVNRTPSRGTPTESISGNEAYLFQSSFSVTLTAADGTPLILPYPETPAEHLDEEEQSLALLYREAQTFAIGHGCAANWTVADCGDRASDVRAECFPVVEIPSTTPEVRRADGTPIEVPMRPLAGLEAGNDGMGAVTEVVERYEEWIQQRRLEIAELPDRYRNAAIRHLDECSHSAQRMRSGLDYLRNNFIAARAFELANYAMLLQQSQSQSGTREAAYEPASRRLTFSRPYPGDSLFAGKGNWRPFQIAFLLMTIASTVDGDNSNRHTVELIWFPTGGGKTEAYLGLSAFSIFYRRLVDPDDAGTQILMRYTLRLLTAQQFQRASGLICAMEYLRRQNIDELGEHAISIGIWLGGDTTPNLRTHAVAALRELKSDSRSARNRFVLTRCPWCGAQIGPVQFEGKTKRNVPRVLGYEQRDGTVALCCADPKCEFHDGLPVHVVDEDIYELRPSLIIGTVDKFAMLAWRPEARSIFGIDANGNRYCSPPGLIIQDELHLISGPLGSMVGLYETVIEELCTDRRSPDPVRPKIVSSTATIRRYREQIKALYARDAVALFPPPGLSASDSFFASYACTPDGDLERGRVYVGVHAPGLGSLQTTQARVFASLLQAPMQLPEDERDPWWTLMVFFNSLRELGSALSLFQSRVPDYLWAIRSRTGVEKSRFADRIKELTSRLRSDEVPAAITELEFAYGSNNRPMDACLASNIIEVGIDIGRLSLMTVVGQPKTTSQYIQVTGRVGRVWWERPGLVVTLLNPTRPRDRSHFEHFRSYHERLYAQVEPTSVTPFSPPTLDRALHAVMVCYARQLGDEQAAVSPQPVPDELIERAGQLLLERVNAIDPLERDNLRRVLHKRKTEWHRWEHRIWHRWTRDDEPTQLHASGEYIDPADARFSWPTPMSMRTVDAECQAEITRHYLDDLMETHDEELVDAQT